MRIYEKYLPKLLLVVVILVFGLSSYAKISKPVEVLRSLEQSQLIPHSVVPFAAYCVIGTELITLLLLCIPSLRKAGIVGTALLSGIYLGYNVWRLKASITVPCGCFGTLWTMPTWSAIALCACLWTAAMYLFKRSESEQPKHHIIRFVTSA